MYPRRDDRSGLFGYWVRDGWAIRPQFNYAHRFVNGYAAVALVGGRRCLIGMDGKLISLDVLCGGRIPIQDERHSFSGFGGYESQPPRYAEVWTTDGERNEWGLIDSSLNYRPLPDDVFSMASTLRPCAEHVVLIRAMGRGAESVYGLFNLCDMRLELPLIYSCIYPSDESI